MVILRIDDKLLVQQVYKINFKSYKVSLIAKSYLFISICRNWKVIPFFTFKDSMHVSGVVLYEEKTHVAEGGGETYSWT